MSKPLVKKENLDKLLSLLPHILHAEENAWFKTAVRKLVLDGGNAPITNGETLHSYAEMGDQYLIINPNAILINYDDIPDEKVRTKLKADCFEMARHRLGRGNHRHGHDFEEFCRYAHFQIEEIINYYYIKKFGADFKAMQSDIINNTPSEDIKKQIAKIPDPNRISIKFKIFAISTKFALGAEFLNTLVKICNTRNELSHRSSLTIESDDEMLVKFQKEKGPIDSLPITEINDKIQTILFKREEAWDKVFDVITKLKARIIRDL